MDRRDESGITRSRQAFDRAIAEGRLSDNERSPLYAGHFMWMGPGTRDDATKYDSFKHSETRDYLPPPPANEAEAIRKARKLSSYDERWKATALDVLRKVEALFTNTLEGDGPSEEEISARLAEVQTLIALEQEG